MPFAAGKAADADTLDPGAGTGVGVFVAKLLAEFRPQPGEYVAALLASVRRRAVRPTRYRASRPRRWAGSRQHDPDSALESGGHAFCGTHPWAVTLVRSGGVPGARGFPGVPVLAQERPVRPLPVVRCSIVGQSRGGGHSLTENSAAGARGSMQGADFTAFVLGSGHGTPGDGGPGNPVESHASV